MKRCTKCGVVKPLEDFGKDKRCAEGRCARCKECLNAARNERAADGRYKHLSKRWKERNPERARELSRERSRRYRAAHPDRVREASRKNRERLLAKNPNYFREWYWKNAEKERERSKAVMRRIRAENPDWDREVRRRYRAKNAEAVKAREREHTYARRAKQPRSPELAALMAELVEQPCVYCGATENITIDHVVPLSLGGSHTPANVRAAHFMCNSRRSNRGAAQMRLLA